MKKVISFSLVCLLFAMISFQAAVFAQQTGPTNRTTPVTDTNVTSPTDRTTDGNFMRNNITPNTYNPNMNRGTGLDFYTDRNYRNNTNGTFGNDGFRTNNLRTYATDTANTMNNWGWLGLVGLIGLAGLFGRGRNMETDR